MYECKRSNRLTVEIKSLSDWLVFFWEMEQSSTLHNKNEENQKIHKIVKKKRLYLETALWATISSGVLNTWVFNFATTGMQSTQRRLAHSILMQFKQGIGH
ncbi:hypothetical protein ACO0LC_06200 [Undibacterium sp. JH2W]|uniref:hypothetical protein n=1 Tax=Undibacterium sp. JH2W TaxID=3413037 RepID=UPI003BEFA0C0